MSSFFYRLFMVCTLECLWLIAADGRPVLSLVPQEHAFESSQKYKEGKFIIELAHMIKDNGWE